MGEEELCPKKNLFLSEKWQNVVEENCVPEPWEISFLLCFHLPDCLGCHWLYPLPNSAFFSVPATMPKSCALPTPPSHAHVGGTSLGPSPAEGPAPVDPSIPTLLSHSQDHCRSPQHASPGKWLNKGGFVCAGAPGVTQGTEPSSILGGEFSKPLLRAPSQVRPLPLKLRVPDGFLGLSSLLCVLAPGNTPERQRTFHECKFQ